MRFVSIVLVLVAVAMASASVKEKTYYEASEAPALFEKFIKDHDRQYKDDADREVHYKAFVASLEKINKLNKQNPSATYGINKFADYTEEERSQMFGLRSKKVSE